MFKLTAREGADTLLSFSLLQWKLTDQELRAKYIRYHIMGIDHQ